MIWGIVIILFVVGLLTGWVILYYPKQEQLPDAIHAVKVTTPKDASQAYHDDCLHPCIRRMSDGRYVMVQSPWYMYNDGVENPILYISDNPEEWMNGIEVAGTPKKGYNSDPNVYEENGRIYVFWREVETPMCDEFGVVRATVGVYTDDEGKTFSEKKVYLTNSDAKVDDEICPILIKKDGKYRFYATWYQTWREDRHNLGIAIWEGSSLEKPDFTLLKKVPFGTKTICDKAKQLKVFGKLFFIPKPHKFDLWHFDLFEKDGKLYMVASEEMQDVVMLAVSEDWERFELQRTPLVNAHYMENYVGYRQMYYKPTAFVNRNGEIQVYYTTNPQRNEYVNRLYTSVVKVR